MAESLELHVVRAFFAKAEKKSPFSDVSFLLSLIHINERCHASQHASKSLSISFYGGKVEVSTNMKLFKALSDFFMFCLAG